MSNMLNIKNRQTMTVALPSYEGSEIVMYKSLLTGEIEELQTVTDGFNSGLVTLQKLIKSWNFVTDEAGTPLEITIEHLKLIPATDFAVLMNAAAEAQKIAETKKETSSSE